MSLPRKPLMCTALSSTNVCSLDDSNVVQCFATAHALFGELELYGRDGEPTN